MGAIKEEPFVADVAVELNDKKKEEKKKKKKKDNKKDDGRDPVVKDLEKEPISNTKNSKKKTQEEQVTTKTPIDSPDAGIKLLEKEKKPKKGDEAVPETETQRVQRMENAANKKAEE